MAPECPMITLTLKHTRITKPNKKLICNRILKAISKVGARGHRPTTAKWPIACHRQGLYVVKHTLICSIRHSLQRDKKTTPQTRKTPIDNHTKITIITTSDTQGGGK